MDIFVTLHDCNQRLILCDLYIHLLNVNNVTSDIVFILFCYFVLFIHFDLKEVHPRMIF